VSIGELMLFFLFLGLLQGRQRSRPRRKMISIPSIPQVAPVSRQNKPAVALWCTGTKSVKTVRNEGLN
jgi:hypothetical protein